MRAIWEEIYSILIGVIMVVVMLPFIPVLLIEQAEGKVRIC